MKNYSPKEAFELSQNGSIIIDVREEYMGYYKLFDVNEVIYCPLSSLEEKYSVLPADKMLIFGDAVGLHSKEAVDLMQSKGFENVGNLVGGIVEWERDGLPLLIDKAQELNGACPCQLRTHKRK
jgi:rhodanese-related sulfurtransferase